MTKTPSKSDNGKEKTKHLHKEDNLTVDPVSRTRKKGDREIELDKIEEQYQQLKNNTEEWIEESKKKFDEAQETIKSYADELAQNVKKNPLTSILIAGGIGFILSSLFRK
ncbi:hypothetical protein [Legionella cardiaca]|uniref:DUF883 domain-containing protein n=1 Tax=Legionella cardiaca TaxID=1071983 RepID=A0ABY8AVC7_9GAMM|nr:hypothetical protein [Legionella cardiaca]WED43696.1 hypothetical protein PXX05_02660 [Legionella cardiaca]